MLLKFQGRTYDPRMQADMVNKYEQVQPTYPPSSVDINDDILAVSTNFFFKISVQKEYLKKRPDVHQYDSNGNSGSCILIFIYSARITYAMHGLATCS